jgi:transcriptional regulator with XRE-family HTH domain
MDIELKTRISNFLKQILEQYQLTQRDLAVILGIDAGRLSAYVKGRELPRLSVAARIAEIGGVTLDELIKTNKPPERKDVFVSVGSVSGNGNIVGSIAGGDIYLNTTVKKTYKYEYQKGDLLEAQAAKLTQLVNEIVELEKEVKRKPKSHAAVWNALKRKFNVAYYRKIREEDFPAAEAYLMMWRGRLTRPLKRIDNAEYRKMRYKSIFTMAQKNLGWTKNDVDNYIYELYNKDSIRDITDKELENLYQRIYAMKTKKNLK